MVAESIVELVDVLESSEELLSCLDDEDEEDDEEDDEGREELRDEDDVLDTLDVLAGDGDVWVILELLMRPAPSGAVIVPVLELDVLDGVMIGSPSSLFILLEIEGMEARLPSKVLSVRTSVVDGSPSSSYRVETGATIAVTGSPS